MEEGVVLALRDVAQQAGLDWDTLRRRAASAKAGCTSRRTEPAQHASRYPAAAMSAAPGRPKQANAPSGGRWSYPTVGGRT